MSALPTLPIPLQTISLLTASNVFMTFAWEPVGLWRSQASRVGKRGQFCSISRRIVGLRNEKAGKNGPLLPPAQQIGLKSDRLPGHLKNLSSSPWYVAALISWGIALFEYLLQVPANRIGHQVLTVGQLKILQEVITLSVFVPFAVWYMHEPLKLDYLWAMLCLVGAAYFIFRGA